MSKPIPLDEQIIAILTNGCTAAAAASTLAAAEARLRELIAAADKAEVASLSPLAPAAKAATLRRDAGDMRFEADRMEASVAALGVRLSELEEAERRARRDVEVAGVTAARDALAAEIAVEYPAIVARLTDLAFRIAENDVLCHQAGVAASAESIGRGIPINFYMDGGPVPRITEIRLPMPASSHVAYEQTMAGWQWRGLDIDVDAAL